MIVFRPMRGNLKSGQASLAGRWWGLLVLCAFCFGSGAVAQDKKDKEKQVDDKTILSPADGWPLRLTYYRSSEGKEAAVVVLLHMKGESRLTWTAPNGFAKQLNDKGFAVIAVDLRKHGQSKPGAEDDDPKKATASDKDKAKKSSGGGDLKPTDYVLMIRDMDAIKKFIFEEHQKGNLNMRKTAIVAPDHERPSPSRSWRRIGTKFRTTMLEPCDEDTARPGHSGDDLSVSGNDAASSSGSPDARKLKATPMAAFVVVGGSDSQDKDQAKNLFQVLGGDPAKTEAPKKKAEPKKASKDKEKDAEKAADKKNEERFFYGELKGVEAAWHGLARYAPQDRRCDDWLPRRPCEISQRSGLRVARPPITIDGLARLKTHSRAEREIDLGRLTELADVDPLVSRVGLSDIAGAEDDGRDSGGSDARGVSAVRYAHFLCGPATFAMQSMRRSPSGPLCSSDSETPTSHGGKCSTSKSNREAKCCCTCLMASQPSSPGMTRRSISISQLSGTVLTLMPPVIRPTLNVARPHSGCEGIIAGSLAANSSRAVRTRPIL